MDATDQVKQNIITFEKNTTPSKDLREDLDEQDTYKKELMKQLKPATDADRHAMEVSSNGSLPEANDVQGYRWSEFTAPLDAQKAMSAIDADIKEMNAKTADSGSATPAAVSDNVVGFNEGGQFASYSSSPEDWISVKSSHVYTKYVDGIPFYSIEGLNAYVVETARGKMICLNDAVVPLSSFLNMRRVKTIHSPVVKKTEKRGTNDLRSMPQLYSDQHICAKIFFSDKESPLIVRGADCHGIIMLARHIQSIEKKSEKVIHNSTSEDELHLFQTAFRTGFTDNNLHVNTIQFEKENNTSSGCIVS